MSAGMSDADQQDDVVFTPDEEVGYLWERHRMRRSKRTLQLYRREGGGPPFFRIGNDVRYSQKMTDKWVAKQRGDPVHNNSEQAARRLLADATKG
jgi:hypothetical protein